MLTFAMVQLLGNAAQYITVCGVTLMLHLSPWGLTPWYQSKGMALHGQGLGLLHFHVEPVQADTGWYDNSFSVCFNQSLQCLFSAPKSSILFTFGVSNGLEYFF